MNNGNVPFHYFQVENSEWYAKDSAIISETPVSLTVNGEVWLTFMCTPVDIEAMAIGFLFNEGLVQTAEEIAHVRLCPTQDNVDVWTTIPLSKPAQWRRTSGCTGGVTSIDNKIETTAPAPSPNLNGVLLSTAQVYQLVGELFNMQDLYRQSGGVHTSLLTDGEGNSIVTEDIGRHNTLDKIAGRCLMENLQFQRRILLTTGRISSEMLQKASRLGASVVISRTSPSSLSIQLAEQYGITLIGYARRSKFNIYTHPHRIYQANLATPDSANISHHNGQKI